MRSAFSKSPNLSGSLPTRLSASKISPFYDREACLKVDKVFCNEIHIPNCIAYDITAGWAQEKRDGVFMPKVYGEIRVTERQQTAA